MKPTSAAFRTWRIIVVAFFSFAICIFNNPAIAAIGDLDPTFNPSGKVTMPFAGNAFGRSVAVAPDGKIIVAGDTTIGSNQDVAVARFLSDGTPDLTFNGTGQVTTDTGLNQNEVVYDVAVQADGKILVVAGGTNVYVFLVFRYTSAGQLDASFGADGVARVDIGSYFDEARSIAIQADGKIVVAGYSSNGTNYDFQLLRLRENGALDPTFGVGGKVTTSFGANNAYGHSVALQPDGKIVVAGDYYTGSTFDFALARYTSSGALDSNFGSGGKMVTPRGSGSATTVSMALKGDGKIVLAGTSHNGSNNDFSIACYTSTGVLDTSFGTGGKVTTPFGSGNDLAQNVAALPDGRIVVAGYSHNGTSNDFALACYTSAGVLDGSFGIGGKVATSFSATNDDLAEGIALQTDGKIVVAGYGYGVLGGGPTKDFALARYSSSGALDTGFGGLGGGKVITQIGNSEDRAHGVALQADGKIVVAGDSHNGTYYDFALARYTSAGALDASFGSGGKVITPIGSNSAYGTSVALQTDGKIVVAGYSLGATTFDFTLARYTSAGVLDTSFGTGGKVVTPIGTGGAYASSVVIQSDGKIVVAGLSGTWTIALARYTSTGALDATFGSGGKVTTTLGNISANDIVCNMALQADGKMVVATHASNGSNYDFVLARFTTAGALDGTFGTSGKVTTAIGSGDDIARSVIIQPDGRIVAAGFSWNGSYYDYALVRYTSTGALDTSFNGTGKVTTPIGTGSRDDKAYSVALQSDGKIVAAGSSSSNGSRGFGIARYTSSGALDTSFGLGGKLVTRVGGNDTVNKVALQSDGKILAVGHSTVGGNQDFALARYVVTDTVAPEAVFTSTHAASTSSTSAAISFTGYDDETPSASLTFEGSLDGAAFAPVTSPVNLSGLSVGSHTYRVKATDAVGNTEVLPASVTWVVDQAAPDTTVTGSPTTPTNSTSATITFNGLDNVTAAPSLTFEGCLDGGFFTTVTSPVNLSSLAQGSHTYEVRAKDEAGNVDATPASVTWVVDTTAPDTSITSSPPAQTNATSAVISFSGLDSVTATGNLTFEGSLDNGTFEPITNSVNLNGLADGSHTYRVRAKDQAGNLDASSASVTWFVDTVAPNTNITSTPPSSTTSTSAAISFTGSDNITAVGNLTYEGSLDGGPFAPVTNPANLSGLADGSHTYQVRSKDAAGNVDPTPASVTWVVDATPPNTSITSTQASPTNATSATINFTGSDNSTAAGNLTFEGSLDGGGFAPITSPKSLTGLSQGSHTYLVRAKDQSGNLDPTPASVTWVVDTTAPDTSITSSQATPTNATIAAISFSGSDNLTAAGSLTFEGSLDGAAFAPVSSPANLSGLSQGSHTYQVRAKDEAGNVDGSPASVTWVVDTTAPETTITSTQTTPTTSTTAAITFTGSDNLTAAGSLTFEGSLDGGAFVPVTSPVNLTGLAEGSHTYQVRAKDASGNVDQTPASVTWVVDLTAPETSITSTQPTPTSSASAAITFTGNDAVSAAGSLTYEGSLDGAAFASVTSPVSMSNLSAGSHTYQVRAKDQAGNVDQSPVSVTWVVDKAAPETTVTSTQATPTNASSAAITFTGSDNVTAAGSIGFEGSLDGASFAPVTSPVNLSGLAEGSHTYQVRARDAAGNLDLTPASVTWVVDTTAPTVDGTFTPLSFAAGTPLPDYTGQAVTSDGISVGSVTQSPAPGSATIVGTIEVTITAKDAANNESSKKFTVAAENSLPTLTLTGNNPLKVRISAAYTDPGATANDFQDGTLTPQITSSTVVPNVPGTYQVTWSVTDSQNATVTLSRSVVVRPEEAVHAEVAAKGSEVPHAGTDARIQTGATWISFGDPAISDTGDVAYLAKWKAPAITGATPLPVQNGAGVFINDTLAVKVGELVPGAGANGIPNAAVFKSFKDPVMDQGGHVAFLATIGGSGVTSANDSVVVSNGRNGTLEIVAREGGVAPETGGAVFKSFTNVSIQGEATGGTLFVATIGGVKGSAPVSGKNNAGVWWLAAGEDSVSKVARKGDPGFATGETIQSIQVLQAISGSTGHGRGQTNGASALLQVGLTGGVKPRQALVVVEPGTLTEIAGTGDTLGGTLLADGAWDKISLPSADSQGADIAVLGTLQLGVANVGKANAKGIFHTADSGSTWEPLARIGGNADEHAQGALFSALGEPVHSSSGAGVAFLATVKGGTGVTGTTNDAIWWKPDANSSLEPLVREGGIPPQPPTGAQWKAFSSLAYPGNGSPIFVATLKPGLPAGSERITSKNDLGLYAVDSFGEVQELIRENQPLLGKPVKTFSALKAIAGSAGSARSYNANSQVAALVTFTDGTTGIVKIEVP